MSRSIRWIPAKFRAITRWGNLDKVLAGIDAAQAAGLAVKINAVALRGRQRGRDPGADRHGRMDEGFDMTLIETMPLGDIDGDRTEQYLPLSVVRARLSERYTLDADRRTHRRPGALCARAETGGGSASSRR